MKSTIEYHHATEEDHTIVIETADDPGAGGAHHSYLIKGPDYKSNPSYVEANDALVILFQNGPVTGGVPNGITIESLLAIAKHRLECFQAGAYPSDYNDRALIYIDQALAALHARTRLRANAGVEGQLVADPQEDIEQKIDAAIECVNKRAEALGGTLSWPVVSDEADAENNQYETLLDALVDEFGFIDVDSIPERIESRDALVQFFKDNPSALDPFDNW